MRDSGRYFILIPVISLLGLLAVLAHSADWKIPKDAAKTENPIKPTKESIEAGKTLYQRQCLMCHGEQGKGDGPMAKELKEMPSDLTDEHVQEQTDGELFWKITAGKDPMPPMEKKLTKEERWHIVNYLRSLVPQKGQQKSGQK